MYGGGFVVDLKKRSREEMKKKFEKVAPSMIEWEVEKELVSESVDSIEYSRKVQ